eukprot:TRINITY_DN7645_c0_g1_i1.p1 TRINITY_DN7645_c0_g1~~TRINITY_DN7645_c0_g1_i1.p1  ORF type:complete len:180 (-),score=34.82 TRINITY_DN7645_c0_g1_i1:121-633(-)
MDSFNRVSAFFDSSSVTMDFAALINEPPATPPTFMESVTKRLTLSYTKRLIAFVTFFLMGAVFLFFSTFSIFSPHSFAKFFTFGNLFIIGSTMFLMGPYKQLKSMCFHPAFQIYALAMIATLYCALSLENTLLTLVMTLVQIAAAVWYGASFIPFAQECLRGSAGAILPV